MCQNSKRIFVLTHPQKSSKNLFLFYRHCRTTGSNHQHTTATAHSLVIKVDTNHGIGTQKTGLFLHFTQCRIFSFTQHFFV